MYLHKYHARTNNQLYGIIFFQTKQDIQAGNFEKARKNSSTARILNIVSVAVGILVILIVILVQLAWIIPVAVVFGALLRPR